MTFALSLPWRRKATASASTPVTQRDRAKEAYEADGSWALFEPYLDTLTDPKEWRLAIRDFLVTVGKDLDPDQVRLQIHFAAPFIRVEAKILGSIVDSAVLAVIMVWAELECKGYCTRYTRDRFIARISAINEQFPELSGKVVEIVIAFLRHHLSGWSPKTEDGIASWQDALDTVVQLRKRNGSPAHLSRDLEALRDALVGSRPDLAYYAQNRIPSGD